MTFPLIGFVSLQAIIFGTIFVIFTAFGFFRGFKLEFSSLLVTVLALFCSVYPALHGAVTDVAANVFPQKAPFITYLAVFALGLLLFAFLMRFVPSPGDVKLATKLEHVLGAVCGFIKAFVAVTMLLVLMQGWHIPGEGLYTSSELSGYVIQFWKKLNVLPELYSFKYLIPFA